MGKRSWKKMLINNLTKRRRDSSQEHLEENHHQTQTEEENHHENNQTSHSEDSFQENHHENNEVSVRPTRAAKVRCVQNFTNIRRTEKSYDLAISRERASKRVANENGEQRERRLLDLRQRATKRIATENDQQRERRLLDLRQRAAKRVATKNNQQREYRLEERRRRKALELNNYLPTPTYKCAVTAAVQYDVLGPFGIFCMHCGALHFPDEKCVSKKNISVIQSKPSTSQSEQATQNATQENSSHIEQVYIKEEPIDADPNDSSLYQELRDSIKTELDNSENDSTNSDTEKHIDSISTDKEHFVNVKKECSDSFENEISVNPEIVKTEQTTTFESVFVKQEPFEED